MAVTDETRAAHTEPGLSNKEQEMIEGIAEGILRAAQYNLLIAPTDTVVNPTTRRLPPEALVRETRQGKRVIIYEPKIGNVLRQRLGIDKLFFYRADKPITVGVGDEAITGDIQLGANTIDGGRFTVGIITPKGKEPGSMCIKYSVMRTNGEEKKYGGIKLNFSLTNNSSSILPIATLDQIRDLQRPTSSYTPLIEDREERDLSGPWKQVNTREGLVNQLATVIKAVGKGVHYICPSDFLPVRGYNNSEVLTPDLEDNTLDDGKLAREFSEAWEACGINLGELALNQLDADAFIHIIPFLAAALGIAEQFFM